MATKRINFQSMNEVAIKTLSDFNKAHYALKALREEFKTNKAMIEKKIEDVRSKREEARKNGMEQDKVILTYDLEKPLAELRALETKYEEACKPHKDVQKECMKWVDSNLYYGYILAQSGSLNSKGKVSLKKGKNTEEVELEKGYQDMIKDFLVKIGCSKTEDDKAMNRFATTMSIRTSGMIKCNKGDDYVKVKSASQYNSLFMLNFLQYLVVEREILVQAEDHTLSMKKYN